MSNDDKSESINFENEQIEQRTLNSDEERKIKKAKEIKAFATSNNFNKKTKDKKNKSQNKYHKTKLPPIFNSKKDQAFSTQRDNATNSFFSTSFSTANIEPLDNDELFSEIHKVQKEIRNLNRELKNLQKEYNIIEESNLTNKYIIEKILNIQDYNNIDEKDNNNEKLTEETKNNEKEEDEKDMTNKNKSKKNKNKKIKIQSEESKKIIALKKQLNLYDHTLQINNNKLEELKKKKKQIQYQQLINLLDGKNREISELVRKAEEFNNILIENDTKIKFYSLQAQQYNDDIIQIQHQMEYEKGIITGNQTDIKNFIEKKENLNNKQKVLDEDLKQKEKKKEEMNEESKKLEKEIEDNKQINKEKEKNEIFLQNFESEQRKYQNEINKIDKKMKLLKQQKETLIKDINNYESERPKLLEKSKIPKKNQEKMKLLQKDIDNLKDQIKKRNEENNVKEKNINNKIKDNNTANNDYKVKINNFIKEKEDLINEIEKNNNDLKNKKDQEEKINQEILEVAKNVSQKKQEYEEKLKEEEEKKEKEKLDNQNEEKIKKQNNLEKENKFNEAKEKYSLEINELKSKNDQLKRDNKNLKTEYETKIKDIKLANEASSKLSNTLEELKKMTPP